MNLLVVYRGLPWPIQEGNHLRILHIFQRLAARHQVHLLSLVDNATRKEDLPALQASGIFTSITLLPFPPRRGLGRLATNVGVEPIAALKVEYPGFSRRIYERVGELTEELGLDAGYVFGTWADALYTESATRLPTVLDVCDSRALYFRRRAEAPETGAVQRLRARQLTKRFEGLERHLLEVYPLATVVSPHDRDYLLDLVPGARVELIPNGVDLEAFVPPQEDLEKSGNLILFGNMDFEPNVDAAVHFAREIFPAVRASHPEATFTIAGVRPAAEVLALAAEVPGVEVTGSVDEMAPWITRSSMLVAPMRFGAGIKNKVLEAMAMERPVVASSMGVEAMHPEVAALVRVADEPAAFAAAVCALLDDRGLRRELGRKGRNAMARLHSWETTAARYEALFAELALLPAG
ncbi:MAG TPA: glycosyltransferase family 4 protein [Planctomycetota bacterium]